MVSLCDDPAERARFFAALVEHTDRGRLVVALRADRMGDLSAYPAFARLVERGLYLLSAMGTPELRAAIEGPAQQGGLLVEEGLVVLLVRDVEGEPGALPLLSHALRETWERREGGTLTVAGYRDRQHPRFGGPVGGGDISAGARRAATNAARPPVAPGVTDARW